MSKIICSLAVAVLSMAGALSASGASSLEDLQAALMSEIRADTRETKGYTGRVELQETTMQAMAAVPRHEFIESFGLDSAYANRPLPIGHGQTISQPFIVALMTDLLDLQPDHVVLEIGTGSGYQAAVLAKLVEHVYTIEIIPELATIAASRLTAKGYDNVSVKTGDGYFGWPEKGPFDGIIVTAVGPDLPPALLAQLKVGAKMVIPVGTPRAAQNLTVVTKLENDGYTAKEVLPVAFVPLTGDH